MLLLFNFSTAGAAVKKVWKLRNKIPQFLADNEVLTPDGQQILVGATKDQVLIISAGFNNWHLKNKLIQ